MPDDDAKGEVRRSFAMFCNDLFSGDYKYMDFVKCYLGREV